MFYYGFLDSLSTFFCSIIFVLLSANHDRGVDFELMFQVICSVCDTEQPVCLGFTSVLVALFFLLILQLVQSQL